eukprot:gene479-6889_t
MVIFKNTAKTWKLASMTDILKWSFNRKQPTIPGTDVLPILKPNLTLIQQPKHKLQSTWIGHSTCLVQMNNKNFLTDPIFSSYAAPLQIPGFPKRIREVHDDLKIEKLPKIDYVVVSHNHYDHLDFNSIKTLKKIHDPVFIVPSKLNLWFYRNGINKVIDLSWWQSHKEDNIEITLLPVQHWSHRNMFDRFKTLWGSFMISDGEKSVYFTGDTGYSSDFKEIGEKFKNVDLALIPIGAYEPRHIMKYQHINPEEAIQIAIDINAKKSMAMHWSTFILTDEPIMEPKEKIEKELQRLKLEKEFFEVIFHSETICID